MEIYPNKQQEFQESINEEVSVVDIREICRYAYPNTPPQQMLPVQVIPHGDLQRCLNGD